MMIYDIEEKNQMIEVYYQTNWNAIRKFVRSFFLIRWILERQTLGVYLLFAFHG